MKKISFLFAGMLSLTILVTSCKKNQPSYKMEGGFNGHFEGNYMGNDTIVNENYLVTVEALDKSTVTVSGTLFTPFDVLVTKNGINVEPVSLSDGLVELLYADDTKELSFTFEKDGNTAVYVGIKN